MYAKVTTKSGEVVYVSSDELKAASDILMEAVKEKKEQDKSDTVSNMSDKGDGDV